MTALSDARSALVTANGAAMRALDQARAEVVGGRETMISRDLLAAVIRLQSCSTHVTSMVLSLVEERRPKALKPHDVGKFGGGLRLAPFIGGCLHAYGSALFGWPRFGLGAFDRRSLVRAQRFRRAPVANQEPGT